MALLDLNTFVSFWYFMKLLKLLAFATLKLLFHLMLSLSLFTIYISNIIPSCPNFIFVSQYLMITLLHINLLDYFPTTVFNILSWIFFCESEHVFPKSWKHTVNYNISAKLEHFPFKVGTFFSHKIAKILMNMEPFSLETIILLILSWNTFLIKLVYFLVNL